MRMLGLAGLLVGMTLVAPTPNAISGHSIRLRPGDTFGDAVAISGSTAVISAPAINRGVKGCFGKAYVFVRSGTGWREQATLSSPTAKAGDCFGSAVAVSSTSAGTFAVIGAPGRDNTGIAYIFARRRSVWHLQATLNSPGRIFNAQFGSAVAISGTMAVVGAPNWNRHGAVYVYARYAGRWHLRARLRDPVRGLLDEFGTSVALWRTTAGNYLVIGDPGVHNGNGVAFVYHGRSAATWWQQARIPNTGRYAGLGSVTAIWGQTAVVGADNSALIYRRSRRSWRRQAALNGAALADEFASAVAIDGKRIVVGAPAQGRKGCGTAYEFMYSKRNKKAKKKTWHERERIVNPGCANGDDFGMAIALSGRTALIGAPDKNHNAGAAYYQTVP